MRVHLTGAGAWQGQGGAGLLEESLYLDMGLGQGLGVREGKEEVKGFQTHFIFNFHSQGTFE